MYRRRLLVTAGTGALGGLNGCLAERGSSTPENADEEQSPGLEYPTHPPELTRRSAREYVAEYEETYQLESLQRYDSASVRCPVDQTVVNYETDDGLYVTIYECGKQYGGNNSIGEGMSGPALYLVTEEKLVRIEPEQGRHGDPSLPGQQPSSDSGDLWLANFDESYHNLTLRIEHHGRESTTVLEQLFNLSTERGISLNTAAEIDEEYEFHVDLGDDQRDTETFTVPYRNTSLLPLGAIVITSDGGLIVDELEFRGHY